jgi:hypothetical protein
MMTFWWLSVAAFQAIYGLSEMEAYKGKQPPPFDKADYGVPGKLHRKIFSVHPVCILCNLWLPFCGCLSSYPIRNIFLM